MARDLDIVAIPWTEEAEAPEQLVLAVLSSFYGATMSPTSTSQDGTVTRRDTPTLKPHGRLAWLINLDNGLQLDLSIMPRKEASRG